MSKYSKIDVKKNCLNCGKEFEVQRFIIKGKQSISQKERKCCGTYCAHSFLTKKKRIKINEKVSKTLKNRPSLRKGKIFKIINHKITDMKDRKKEDCYCKKCGKFLLIRTKNGFCNFCCRNDINYRKKLSKIQKERVKNGTHIGWQVRPKLSFAEKFFVKVLKNNNLFSKCEVNKPILKKHLGLDCRSNYFLDFFFKEKMIDLEIDGKQHNYPDRIKFDKIRDKALTQNGYKVYRIKWKDLRKNKLYIKIEIDKFLNFYNDAPVV